MQLVIDYLEVEVKKNVYKYYKNNIKLKQKCVVLNQNIKADP